jgi:hypothetical protein
MYLSDRDLAWAIQCGRLIIKPDPKKIDATSIDLHLDSVERARVWDLAQFEADRSDSGEEARELRTSQIHYRNFSREYLIPVPSDEAQAVFRRHNQIVIKPRGFLLLQTHEIGPKEAVGQHGESDGFVLSRRMTRRVPRSLARRHR